jgi:small subunit ribosomal protein S20
MAEKPKEQKKVKLATAKKRQLQDTRKRVQNKGYRSEVKTAYKAFLASLKQQDKEVQMGAFSSLASLVDKGVNKGIFKLNKASRVKARMSARLQAKQAA